MNGPIPMLVQNQLKTKGLSFRDDGVFQAFDAEGGLAAGTWFVKNGEKDQLAVFSYGQYLGMFDPPEGCASNVEDGIDQVGMIERLHHKRISLAWEILQTRWEDVDEVVAKKLRDLVFAAADFLTEEMKDGIGKEVAK